MKKCKDNVLCWLSFALFFLFFVPLLWISTIWDKSDWNGNRD